MASQLKLVASDDRRANDRAGVALWGRIRFRGTSHPARICNISPGGVLAMTPFALRDFCEVDVEMPVIGWRSALVAWTRGDNVGLEFDPPLAHAAFDKLSGASTD